jgi:hypothetical protein
MTRPLHLFLDQHFSNTYETKKRLKIVDLKTVLILFHVPIFLYDEHPPPLRTSRFIFEKTVVRCYVLGLYAVCFTDSSSLGSTAQLRPWPPPQNPAEFLGGFSTIFFFIG